MASSPMFGRWGFLPIAVPCVLFLSKRLGELAFPTGAGSCADATRRADRLLAGVILILALIVVAVRILGSFHLLIPKVLIGALFLAAAAMALRRRRSPIHLPLRRWASPIAVVLLAEAIAAIGLSIVAALRLPVWQWDALGYHLPYVNFVLVARGFEGVPDDMPYVSTYPHVVEMFFVALRAMLPDDRLVDLAQIPFALLGGLATAGIARRLNAPSWAALAAGAAWILAPAVFLQMPTDYVDVAAAALFLAAVYFVLSASSHEGATPGTVRKELLLGGIAIALYIGAKPNTPPSAAILFGLLGWVGIRAGQQRAVVATLFLVLLGSETFIINALRHGNPVWPVAVSIGPFSLHGNAPMQHLLDSGAAAPHLHGPLAWRVLRSWCAIASPPVFDMRIGGFGPLVLAALPAAILTTTRRKDPVVWGALLASVATPDPSVARYVLAFPAMALALATPCAAALPNHVRPGLGAAAGILGLAQIVYALPGMTADGPGLWALGRLTDAERAQAVGADGPPAAFLLAQSRVGSDETFAFDASMELPYLAWPSDLHYRAVWIPHDLSSDATVEDFLDVQKARVVAVADNSPVGSWLSRRPERFLKLFKCKASPCSVFARR